MHTESFIILITDSLFRKLLFPLDRDLFLPSCWLFFSLSLHYRLIDTNDLQMLFFFIPMPLSIGMSILVRIIDYIFDRSIRVTLLELLESEERMIDFF